jgi:hypothetical protein
MTSNSMYCEFCGAEIKGVRTPDKLVRWIHNIGRDVVRCDKHRRTSKTVKACRTFNPFTGEKSDKPLYRIK